MQRIAIMQGSLTSPGEGAFQGFPRNHWRDEFAHAAAAGLDAIEWIYDLQGAGINPLATNAGISEIHEGSREHGTAVVSLCANYFLDRPFVKAGPGEFGELTGILQWLIGRCDLAGIRRIVLPFVEVSRIETAQQEDRVVEMFERVLPKAEHDGVQLHLKTAYGPAAMAGLLARLPHAMLKANFDSGNSAALGYDLRGELAAYGKRIGSVHVRDCLRGGGTVPLGTGDADLPHLFDSLSRLGYTGDYVLHGSRADAGHEIDCARQGRAFLVQRLKLTARSAR